MSLSHGCKISIVVPSFNQGCFIEETLLSIIRQDHRDVELIVMDGGSTDETVSIIERYAEHIAFWVSARDAGQSDALDRGFRQATGDVLAWVNSDDMLVPGALAAVAAAFASGDVDIVAGVVNVRKDGDLVYRHRTGHPPGILSLEKIVDLEGEWLTGRFFYQPEVFFSRAIYEAAGALIDTALHYSMDYDLWLRCARATARIRPIDYELAEFRLHAEQKTSTVAAYLPELTAHANAARAALSLPAVAPDAGQFAGRRLKVGMLNDHGFKYGAGRAHRRLAECLAASQVEVVVYALRDGLDDMDLVDLEEGVEALRAAKVDVIVVGNLHGAFAEGVDLSSLANIAPVLLVTHDFFWLTGRCPYPMGCERYLSLCPPECPTRDHYPVIPYERIPDAHRLKLANLALPNVYLAPNSAYMERESRRALAAHDMAVDADTKIRRIHLPVPEPAYVPGDRTIARAGFGLKPGETMVLTVSSSVTDARKRFQHVVEARDMVGRDGLRLVAMGWVSSEDQLDHVTYTGHLDDDEAIARCYRAADVFVSAAADETFGQTFVEAAMCGCPSIGYDVGAVSEVIVEGQTGWLVQRDDVTALAERLRAVCEQSPDERAALRRRAHLVAKSRFGAPSFLAGFNDVLRDILADRAIKIATGVQYDGMRTLPIDMVERLRIRAADGLGPSEGPFPEHDVSGRLQWQFAPTAKLAIHTPAAGLFQLRLVLANLFLAQEITISCNGDIIGRIEMAPEGWNVRHEIVLALEVAKGETILSIYAPAGFATGERRLHLALFEPTIAPLDSDDGLRGIVHHQRIEIYRYVKAADGFTPAEGPFPDLGIDRTLQWQVEPRAHVSLNTSAAGPFVATLSVASPLIAQKLTISRGREVLLQVCLEPEDWTVHHEIMLPLELPVGETVLEFHTSDGEVSGDRTLRLALLKAKLEPPETLEGPHGIRRVERLPDVTADEGFRAAEGPFPDLGFDGTLQWLVAPRGTLTLRARNAGTFLLTFVVANIFLAQEVAVLRGGDVLIRADLLPEGWQVRHEIEITLDLAEGDNHLTIFAPNGEATDDRSLHLAFLGASLSEADLDGGRCEVRRVEHRAAGIYLTPAGGFDPAEGPFPEHGMERTLQWLVQPEGRLEVQTLSAGSFLVTIAFANPYVSQEIAIARGSDILARLDLQAEDWGVCHEVAIALDLPEGETPLTVMAPEGLATEQRKLYLAFYEARLEPTDVGDGLRGVLRHEIPRKRPDVTADEGFASPEGPLLDLGIAHTVQWQVRPDASLTIHAPAAGAFLVSIVVASPHVAQTLVITRGVDILASVNLRPEGWSVSHEIAFALDLPEGDTSLTLSAPNALRGDERDLHLVVLGAELEPTHVGDGLRSVRRVNRRLDGHSASQAASLPSDLLIGSGFASVEGPYPELGVPMALVWQIERTGRLQILAPTDTLAIDVVVPCDQVIIVRTGGISRVFDVPKQAGWERPSRIVLPLGGSSDGWQDVELTCEREFEDGSGRSLWLALLGAEASSRAPEHVTDRYGYRQMPLDVLVSRAERSRAGVP